MALSELKIGPVEPARREDQSHRDMMIDRFVVGDAGLKPTHFGRDAVTWGMNGQVMPVSVGYKYQSTGDTMLVSAVDMSQSAGDMFRPVGDVSQSWAETEPVLSQPPYR
eukprot:COSAG02_NODE_1362_length_13050_cov_22.164775_7_plen_109_part_00